MNIFTQEFPQQNGCSILNEQNTPSHYNCMMYAVGNSHIAKLFEDKMRLDCYAECFVNTCAQLGVTAKEVSKDIATSSNEHIVAVCMWARDIDTCGFFPYDYHVYRSYNKHWTHKDGTRGPISDVPMEELNELFSLPRNEVHFFILSNN